MKWFEDMESHDKVVVLIVALFMLVAIVGAVCQTYAAVHGVTVELPK